MTAGLLLAHFREVRIPATKPPRDGNPGVYILLEGEVVVYVGSSGNVPVRVREHAERIGSPYGKPFDRAVWLSVPAAVVPYYEGALIRAFKPRHNLTAPAADEHDVEILDGLDLGHLTTDGWREHIRAVRGRERARDQEQRERDRERVDALLAQDAGDDSDD